MPIDPALLSSASALAGAIVGGSASLAAAVYTTRAQTRQQRVAQEVARREAVYAAFVMNASKLLVDATTHDGFTFSPEAQALGGLLNRMRLFASPEIVRSAEHLLKHLADIALAPSLTAEQFARHLFEQSTDHPLTEFSRICRADLDAIPRQLP